MRKKYALIFLFFFFTLIIYGITFHWNLPTNSEQINIIIYQYRIPRLLVVALTGAALTLGGIQFQAILRNPLADPFILGISSGAAFGKVLAILFIAPIVTALPFLSGIGITILEYIFALLGALLSVIIVYLTALRHRQISAGGILLSGIVINAFFGSGLIFLIQLADPMKFIGIKSWLSGRIPLLSFTNIAILTAIVLLLSLLAYYYKNEFNQISIGERFAHSKGLNVGAFRIKVFFLVSMLIAPIVAHTGVIGFVGLILPHILRLMGFSNHRLLIPVGVVGGAMYLVLADFMLHLIQANEQVFTIGAFTAIIGAPIFLFLLARDLKKLRN